MLLQHMAVSTQDTVQCYGCADTLSSCSSVWSHSESDSYISQTIQFTYIDRCAEGAAEWTESEVQQDLATEEAPLSHMV
jgi:hypothetical protein